MKKSFTFRFEWLEALKGASPEIRLEVYEATIQYATSGTLPELSPVAAMAMAFIKQDIDKRNRTSRTIAEPTKAENGEDTENTGDSQNEQAPETKKAEIPGPSKTLESPSEIPAEYRPKTPYDSPKVMYLLVSVEDNCVESLTPELKIVYDRNGKVTTFTGRSTRITLPPGYYAVGLPSSLQYIRIAG